MDTNTKRLIDKFKQNPEAAQNLLNSGDGQALLKLLTQNHGGASLERAAQSAAQGDPKELSAMLSGLMNSPDGMALMQRLRESAQK